MSSRDLGASSNKVLFFVLKLEVFIEGIFFGNNCLIVEVDGNEDMFMELSVTISFVDVLDDFESLTVRDVKVLIVSFVWSDVSFISKGFDVISNSVLFIDVCPVDSLVSVGVADVFLKGLEVDIIFKVVKIVDVDMFVDIFLGVDVCFLSLSVWMYFEWLKEENGISNHM